MKRTFLIGLALIPFAAWGQSSASFSIASSTFNSGGTSGNGSPTSASYSVSGAAIGETVSAATLTSASFSMDIGFVRTNRPAVVIFSDGFESADVLDSAVGESPITGTDESAMLVQQRLHRNQDGEQSVRSQLPML